MLTGNDNPKQRRRESSYPAVRPGDCLLDIANPGWYIKDYSKHGKALRADYKLQRDKYGQVTEHPEQYWDRIRKQIMTEFNTETQEWEVSKEETVSADQADAAIAEAMEKLAAKQADLPETDEDEGTDEQPRPF